MSIFILQSSRPNYRLDSYRDFVERFHLHYPDVLFYGEQYHGMQDAPPWIIPEFTPGLSMQETFDKYLGGNEPEALFLFSSSQLKHFAKSDLRGLKCPVFLLFTDAPSWDDGRLEAMRMHDLKPFRAVCHNYMHKLDELKAAVAAEHFELFPCWSSHVYDSESRPIDKDLEFMISGVPGGDEYIHRDIFARAVHGHGMSVHAALGPRINEPDNNACFLRDLLRSKFSPHDGGVNGRLVPRYAESGFARSVPISPDLGEEMRRAGWVHNKNCILFPREERMTPDSCLELLEETRKRTDWGDLAACAYDLVSSRHSTDCRIRRFLEMAL